MLQFQSKRPPVERRRFISHAVDSAIEEVSAAIRDPELAWLFANCLPNTLDTTVTFGFDCGGKPDTFVITGDIDAMWLRDSTNQVWPYLSFLGTDAELRTLIAGLIHRQAACVRLDSYANAFFQDGTQESEWASDKTEMRPGVHERKYELDSLCAFFRLSCGYWAETSDASCFDLGWQNAVAAALDTIELEQAGSEEGISSPYTFQRVLAGCSAQYPNQPSLRCGLSKSPFRPSDDPSLFPFLVPANAMTVVCLRQLAEMLTKVDLALPLGRRAASLAEIIENGLRQHALVSHPVHGEIWAYEIDGFGGRYLMDDANVPSLLSLPYLGYCAKNDPLYQRTRAFVLSPENPYYAEGAAGRGIGGPHVGPGWIWPMSITMQALTSDSDEEIAECLRLLKASHAGTGFIHETFWKDDAARFTRPWFAWANTLFGELLLTLHRERPHLLG